MPWVPSEVVASYTRSGTADWNGDWVLARIGALLLFEVVWSADAGTSFELGLEGTQDPSRSAASIIRLPTLTAATPLEGMALGIYGDWPTVGAAAGNAAVLIKSPFANMRVIGVGAGGVADQFTIYTEFRGS